MPVDELQQAAYTIISVSPALGLAMDSLAAKTAASSLPALVTDNIVQYTATAGAADFAATVVTGTTIATTGEIVLTAAAIVAVGAFLSWLIDKYNLSKTPTEIVNETFIKVGNAKGILFPDSTTSILYSAPYPSIAREFNFYGGTIRYLPDELVSNARACTYDPLSSRFRWSSSEDSQIYSYWEEAGSSVGSKNIGYWRYRKPGTPTDISYSSSSSSKAGYLPSAQYPSVYIQMYKNTSNLIGIAAYVRYIGKKLYQRTSSGSYNLVGNLPDGYYINQFVPTDNNVDPNGVYFYRRWEGFLEPANPRLDPNADISTGGTAIINAQIADRGMWKPADPLITGDNVIVKLPVIPGATDITDLSQITQETLDNLSENVLDGNLSPETVTEPTVDYAPSSPTVSPPHIDIPPATDAPTFTPDSILPPPLPIISAVSSQFVKLYNPTQSEIATLSSFMLSQGFVDNVLKLFANPADYVLDLAIIPTSVPVTAEKEPVHIGNVLVPELTMNKVTEQYITRDMGSITISPAYHDFVDYQASAYIFLPYIGERELNINDIMGSTLHLTYNIDVLTGACTAMLHVTNPTANTPIDAVLYQWSGNVLTRIPITSTQWSTSIGQIATAVGSMVAGGIPGTVVAGSMLATAGISPRVSSIGNLSSNAGLLGVQTPYVMLSIPRVATPSNYTAYAGRATSKVAHLGDVQGMVVVEDIHLEGLPATTDEISEIENLLHEGVQV